MERVQLEGNRKISRKKDYYNLDMIISIGFIVNSKTAIKFRTWANKIIKEYMVKGFTLNDDRFINGNRFDTRYFDELLERIKVIRTSERMAYQNTGHTAAELIYERASSEKIHMGLTNWKNSPDGLIYKYDVGIAKNYLSEEELKKLNNLTTLFLDYAEDMAEEQNIMTMQKWIDITDKLISFRDKKVLKDSGKVSHKKAIEKTENEYEKFRIKQDREYISSMDEMYKKYLEENKK